MDNIEIIGASENNLKFIDVTIPKGKLVVLAGISGSGKSSLAFDTIAVESNRQWQDSYPLYLRNKMPHYERPKVDAIHNLTPSIVVDQKPIGVNARSTVGTVVDAAPLLRLLFSYHASEIPARAAQWPIHSTTRWACVPTAPASGRSWS